MCKSLKIVLKGSFENYIIYNDNLVNIIIVLCKNDNVQNIKNIENNTCTNS